MVEEPTKITWSDAQRAAIAEVIEDHLHKELLWQRTCMRADEKASERKEFLIRLVLSQGIIGALGILLILTLAGALEKLKMLVGITD